MKNALDQQDRLRTLDVPRIDRELRHRLSEWRGLLSRQTPLSRQVLHRLLDGGRVTCTPHREDGRYELSGFAKYDRILAGIVDPQRVVPVRGFEPRSRG